MVAKDIVRIAKEWITTARQYIQAAGAAAPTDGDRTERKDADTTKRYE